MTLEGLPGLSAVKSDRPGSGMAAEQAENVVWHFTERQDAAVHAAWALASLEQIPQGNPIDGQALHTEGVIELRIKPTQIPKDLPEAVARMGVVMAHLKRAFAGHRAEDKQRWGRSDNCRE